MRFCNSQCFMLLEIDFALYLLTGFVLCSLLSIFGLFVLSLSVFTTLKFLLCIISLLCSTLSILPFEFSTHSIIPSLLHAYCVSPFFSALHLFIHHTLFPTIQPISLYPHYTLHIDHLFLLTLANLPTRSLIECTSWRTSRFDPLHLPFRQIATIIKCILSFFRLLLLVILGLISQLPNNCRSSRASQTIFYLLCNYKH